MLFKRSAMNIYQKTGYLTENFRYFHLQTTSRQEFHYHYHEFYKILFFLKGDVTYHIEGRTFHFLRKKFTVRNYKAIPAMKDKFYIFPPHF